MTGYHARRLLLTAPKDCALIYLLGLTRNMGVNYIVIKIPNFLPRTNKFRVWGLAYSPAADSKEGRFSN